MKRVYGHMLEVELNFRGRTEVSSKFILRLIIFNQEQQKHEGIVFKKLFLLWLLLSLLKHLANHKWIAESLEQNRIARITQSTRVVLLQIMHVFL